MTAVTAGPSLLADLLRQDWFSQQRCGELDRAEEFPTEICRRLDQAGLPAWYVPADLGGRLASHQDVYLLLRELAGRDVTVAVAHGKTYLGAICVWLAGDDDQRLRTGRLVSGGSPVSWALTEPEHGADLLAGQLRAERTATGYRLHGTKWPVNNATRGRAAVVLARTGELPGSRGFSLFLVDKSALAPGSYRLLPKVRTHGIRGADISGIVFDGAQLPASAMLGAPGTGAQTVLRGLQLTRTVCTALSVGAGRHALRLALGFARERVIQDKPLLERPHIRAVLARAAGALWAAEAAGLLAIRCAHTLTGELSVLSAVVKPLAPTLVDGLIGELGELVGLRAHLVDGAFQKLRRDHGVVAVFDGSSVVNRHALINQFPRLVRGFSRGTADAEGLRRACDLSVPLGPLDWAQLTLLSRDGCGLVQTLPALAGQLAELGAPAELVGRAAAVAAAAGLLHERMAALRPSPRPSMPAFELAAAYELVFAAAAALRIWAANADTAGHAAGWQDALWVRITVRELLTRLRPHLTVDGLQDGVLPDDPALDTAVTGWLTAALDRDEPLSPFDLLTAGAP